MSRSVRHLLSLLALLVFVLHPAEAGELVDGGFGKGRGRPGAPFVPEGFRVEGDENAITRHVAPEPHGPAVAIGEGATLVAEVTVPVPRKPEKVDPDRWYAVVSVDVLGRTSTASSPSQIRADVHANDGRARLGSASMDVTSPVGKETARLWVHVPARRLEGRAGEAVEITLSMDGDGQVVVDDLRFDVFHEEPSRPLVGKPNGFDGPDLLASGMLGFLGLTEHGRTAFSLLAIREGGPADRAGLERSDLVIGVGDAHFAPGPLSAGTAWFVRGHEAAVGRAIESALAEGRDRVPLRVLRDGREKTLSVKLPLARRSTAADLGERMRKDVVGWVATHQKKNGLWPGSPAVNAYLAGLALLATRDRSHAPALKRLVDRLLETNPRARDTKGFSYWPIAFQGIFFCEYYLASGDKRVLAWIEDAIEWLPTTTHECRWGMQAFGHSPKGLPYGNKALMAPTAHLLVFDALAERCGVRSGVWDHVEPYVMHSWSDPEKGGHGGMGYNAAAKDKSQFWSRTGLVALALHLRDHHEPMQEALTSIMVERHPWMLNSHAYGEPGGALGLIALAVVDPGGYERVQEAWRWRLLNAWEPGFGLRYSSAHMGAPYMGEEEIMNPAYALLFGVEDEGLVLAGARPRRWLPRAR